MFFYHCLIAERLTRKIIGWCLGPECHATVSEWLYPNWPSFSFLTRSGGTKIFLSYPCQNTAVKAPYLSRRGQDQAWTCPDSHHATEMYEKTRVIRYEWVSWRGRSSCSGNVQVVARYRLKGILSTLEAKSSVRKSISTCAHPALQL